MDDRERGHRGVRGWQSRGGEAREPWEAGDRGRERCGGRWTGEKRGDCRGGVAQEERTGGRTQLTGRRTRVCEPGKGNRQTGLDTGGKKQELEKCEYLQRFQELE